MADARPPDDFHRWLNTLIIGACGTLLGVIWYMLQLQIAGVGAMVAEVRSDAKVIQAQANDLHGVVKGLEQRIQDLVDTFNRKK